MDDGIKLLLNVTVLDFDIIKLSSDLDVDRFYFDWE